MKDNFNQYLYRRPAETVADDTQSLTCRNGSFGEIERLTDAHELLNSCGHRAIEKLRPIHQTGSGDTIDFASALRSLDNLECP